MASTSHTAPPQIKHDVFINFRGKDTRKGFTSHLRAALKRNGIDAFTDKRLRGGEEISETLSTKISESQVSVVIFSQNYADSRWCLDELVKIIQCNKDNGQAVLPVFLGVEPTHVRHLSDAFGKGFSRLIQDERYKDKEKIWRRALEKTVSLSGWDATQMSEGKIVEKILECIQNRLSKMSSNDSEDNFVGSGRVEEIELLLRLPEVISVGIWGMGGSGKTTLAKKVFKRISNNFESVCFVENVSDGSERYGNNCLRNSMLFELLEKGNQNKGPQIFYDCINRRLRRKRVLIVLDDVSNSEQLEAIIGDCESYCPGSKIIATSRDKQVLKNWCKETYEVKNLDDGEALQLLKLHIFKQRQPTIEHIQLLEQAIKYTEGLALALVILGRNLYDKDIRLWKSELAKLNDIPDMQITKILRTSFDGLEETEKSIFLDIACLFEGWNKDCVENIMDACGFYGTRGIDRLVDKALVTISYDKLRMHDLLQQIGQHIAFHESIKETGTPSRLWRFKDIFQVLTQNQGTKTMSQIEVISLDFSKATTDLQLKSQVFERMTGLRVLHVYSSSSSMNVRMLLPKGLKYLPNELRYLRWDQYPLPSLPQKFASENIVELHMIGSHLKQFLVDDSEPYLPNLRYIDLSNSKNLTKLPTFRNSLKLETLRASSCETLEEIPNSIQHLAELKFIHLDGSKIHALPECSHLTKLETLIISWCSKIKKLPELPRNLIHLKLSDTPIKELPSSIGCLSQLECLMLDGCHKLESLPSSIGEMRSLERLSLSRCPKLLRLPASFSGLKPLKTFIIDGSLLPFIMCDGYKGDIPLSLVSLTGLFLWKSELKCLREDIKYLLDLRKVFLYDCKYLSLLPEIPPSIHTLDVHNCPSLVKYTPASFRKDHQRVFHVPERLRLQFTNCLNLEKDARNQIMSDFWLRTLIILDSAKENWPRIKNPSGLKSQRLSAGLQISKSEVPKWFNHYAIGSSLQLKTNHKRALDFHRLAFCVVVAFQPNSRLRSFEVRCESLAKSGEKIVSSCIFEYPNGKERAEDMFIWYNHYESFQFYVTKAVFQFYSMAFDEDGLEITSGFEIVKCGVTPFWEKHPTGGSTLIEDGNYVEEEEGPSVLERSRKRKRGNLGDQEEQRRPAIRDLKIMQKSEHHNQGNILGKADKEEDGSG